MEARIVKLEESAAATRERFAAIEARMEQFATKADLAALEAKMQKGFADVIKWMVGLAIVLSATSVTVITFVLNNATPRAALPAPQPPVVIYTQQAPPK